MLKPNPQYCDAVCRWGLCEVIRSLRQKFHEWDQCPSPVHHARTQWEDRSVNQEAGPLQMPNLSHDHTGALTLDFQGPFHYVRNKCLLFISHPVYGALLWQPVQTKTGKERVKALLDREGPYEKRCQDGTCRPHPRHPLPWLFSLLKDAQLQLLKYSSKDSKSQKFGRNLPDHLVQLHSR